jgi:hypothetical protein
LASRLAKFEHSVLSSALAQNNWFLAFFSILAKMSGYGPYCGLVSPPDLVPWRNFLVKGGLGTTVEWVPLLSTG